MFCHNWGCPTLFCNHFNHCQMLKKIPKQQLGKRLFVWIKTSCSWINCRIPPIDWADCIFSGWILLDRIPLPCFSLLLGNFYANAFSPMEKISSYLDYPSIRWFRACCWLPWFVRANNCNLITLFAKNIC